MFVAGALDRAGNALQMLFEDAGEQRVAVGIILIEASDGHACTLGDTGRRAATQALLEQNLNGRDVQRFNGDRGARLNWGFSGL